MSTLSIALVALVKMTLLIFGFVMAVASLLTWMERRQSAMMQDRLGPNRANIGRFRAWGLLHIAADGLKMFFKEDFIPARAHRALFTLAPVMALAPAIIVFAIVPFGDFVCLSWSDLFRPVSSAGECMGGSTPLQVAELDMGLLFYFAVASVSVYGAVLAGWSSYNKWGLLGGLRAASQMMAYEVTMGMSILGVFLVYGTLEPGALVRAQGPDVLAWGVVRQPLAFLLFLVAAIAETKRTPFDQVEGEPEIIGYFVEYSGMRFGMFYLGEFIEVVFASAILVTAFFGGWQFPGLDAARAHLPHALALTLGFGIWGLKVLFFCWLQIMIRWTLPRFRPDQILKLGWLKLLPASILNVIATAIVILWLKS
jgi:NADH-quinone oxidoreductase subunit H